MKFEQPVNKPPRTYEFEGKSFPVEDVSVFRPEDIKPGDRVLITTRSGNRYMIRYSKSAKAPKIYSEREQFRDGQELYNKYNTGEAIAEIGKPLKFTTILDKEKMEGQNYSSTEVVAIEIRRGMDDAIESSSPKQRDFRSITQALIDHAKGKRPFEE